MRHRATAGSWTRGVLEQYVEGQTPEDAREGTHIRGRSRPFMKYLGSNTGEMAELAEGARLLSECTVKSRTEGSNPSLSAIAIS